MRRAARGRTYLVEALLLLACLLAVACVVMAVFTRSLEVGVQTQREQEAIVLAQNAAERFAADPLSVPYETDEGEYRVLCTVSTFPRPNGTWYDAHVAVMCAGEEAFSLDTARYVSASDAEVL